MAKSGPPPAAPRASREGVAGGTKAALVQAAVAALREVGYVGASAREIARRAGCHQSQVFYHFGSVTDLLLAALDDVSARRLAAYRPLLDEARDGQELADLARRVVLDDLAHGDLRVLVEMLTAAQAVPGLGPRVEERLVPWHAFAQEAVRKATADLPFGALAPVPELGHALVAGILGLELLAGITGDVAPAERLLTAVGSLATLVGGPR